MMNQSPPKVVPFFAADQPIVDTLCDMIEQLGLLVDLPAEKIFEDRPEQLELFMRITAP